MFTKVSLILTLSYLLTGCGYSYNEIKASKETCASYNGEFMLGHTGNMVTGAYCKVDGIKYRIGRSSFELQEGMQ